MICFEISVNDRTLCTAGIADEKAEMSAMVCAIHGGTEGSGAWPPTIRLDVNGAVNDTQMTWLDGFDQVHVGDTITLRVIECAQADAPRSWKDMKTLPMRREEDLDRDENRCCFCHKTASERRRLIAGPPVFVCNECVSVCVDILENNAEHRTGETG